MRWNSLVSLQNLRLAWRRINTARNIQYKRFFRQAYLVYESAVEDNLTDLRRRLLDGTWEPSYATRLYLPKPSGLQRPLSLLAIEDQIVLPAISNLFAKKLRDRRKRIELETIFSNILAEQSDSIFFVERWQTAYSAFQDRCSETFESGYRWAADFDLAAYYDTISHDLLLNIGSPRNSDPKATRAIRDWLRIWSADNASAETGHGIPQGPVASDFLAEAFFLPIDFSLRGQDFVYLRYVDDIRIFGRTENDVRRAAIQLEQECRHRGLIPQSAKFEVRELRSAEEAMGALPSISPSSAEPEDAEMEAEEARAILESSLGGRPLKVEDKSRFRYVMYRAPEDTKLLDRALMLLPRHPEHIDGFVAYFQNFTHRPKIARVALSYLLSKLPYSYVRRELWHLVASFGGTPELRAGLAQAREDARTRKRRVALSWGVMHFLLRCQSDNLCKLGNRLGSENAISRSLLASIFPEREFARGGHIVTLLKGTSMEQLAGAREMQRRAISLNAVGLRQRDIGQLAKNSLQALGVIRRVQRSRPADWIAETLAKLYQCSDEAIWHELLDIEYEHALQILVEVNARFHGAYSEWLGLQDSFNDLMVRCLFRYLASNGLPGHSALVGRNGALVNYGSPLSTGGPFEKTYPSIATRLRALHDRRNTLPGSHPYNKKGGSRNRWLSRREKSQLEANLRVALNDIKGIIAP